MNRKGLVEACEFAKVFLGSVLVRFVSFGWVIKVAKVDAAVVDVNVSLPLAGRPVAANAFVPAGIAGVSRLVCMVLRWCGKAKVLATAVAPISVLMVDFIAASERAVKCSAHDNPMKVLIVPFSIRAPCMPSAINSPFFADDRVPAKKREVSIAGVDCRHVSLAERYFSGVGGKVKLYGSRIGGMIVHSGPPNQVRSHPRTLPTSRGYLRSLKYTAYQGEGQRLCPA